MPVSVGDIPVGATGDSSSVVTLTTGSSEIGKDSADSPSVSRISDFLAEESDVRTDCCSGSEEG